MTRLKIRVLIEGKHSCRRIDNQFNVFKGITKNKFFVGIFLITIIGQILIVQFGGSAFQTVPLHMKDWVLCILVGLMSLPVGALIRLIPDEILESAHPSPLSSTASVINHTYIVPIPDDSSSQSKRKSLRW